MFSAAKLRKNESRAKENRIFLLLCRVHVTSAKPKLRKVERNTKQPRFFLFVKVWRLSSDGKGLLAKIWRLFLVEFSREFRAFNTLFFSKRLHRNRFDTLLFCKWLHLNGFEWGRVEQRRRYCRRPALCSPLFIIDRMYCII